MPFLRTARTGTPARVSSPGIILALIIVTQLMIVLDVSVVITALPKIHSSLGFSEASLSWVQNAYTLTFGGLLLLGARAGDILGRRRVFMTGIALFTLASMAGGLAQSPGSLLAARAIQGIGAAIAAPSALALLTTTFAPGAERARAISLYAAVGGGGGSLGLVLGGLLTQVASWRWGLFINVPIGAALLYFAPLYLPETERSSGHFDVSGAIASTVGMSALVYGFVRAGESGWTDPITLASFIGAGTLLTGFVLNERRAEQPITPLRLFSSRTRVSAYVARMLLVSGMFAMFFFVTQYLQGVKGYSPLTAGVAFLPMTLVMFTTTQTVTRIAPKLTPTSLMLGGLSLAALAMGWLSRLSESSGYFPQLAIPMVMMGIGIGLAFAPLTSAGIEGVEPKDAGAASGLVNVAQQLGGSLGLSILVAIFTSSSRAAGGTAQHELAHGIATAVSGSAAFLLLAMIVVALGVRRRPAPAVALAEARAA